jgi:hypothetical protein
MSRQGFFVPPLVLSTFVITLRKVVEPIGDVEMLVEPPPPFVFEEDEDEVAFFAAAYTGWYCESMLAVPANNINNVATEIILNLPIVSCVEFPLRKSVIILLI